MEICCNGATEVLWLGEASWKIKFPVSLPCIEMLARSLHNYALLQYRRAPISSEPKAEKKSISQVQRSADVFVVPFNSEALLPSLSGDAKEWQPLSTPG